MSCLCVWAHSWAHTSILVSSLCVPGPWKCQIIRLEGRRPPAGGTQKMWGGGGGMVPFVQLSLSTALLHHHSTLKLPVILFSPVAASWDGKKVWLPAALRQYFIFWFIFVFYLFLWALSLLHLCSFFFVYRHIFPPPHPLCVATPSLPRPSVSLRTLPLALPHKQRKRHKKRMVEWLHTKEAGTGQPASWGLEELESWRHHSSTTAVGQLIREAIFCSLPLASH